MGQRHAQAEVHFTGQVRGDTIEGSVVAALPRPGDDEAMDEVRVPWRARRSPNPAYFAPTGTQIGLQGINEAPPL